MSAFIVRVRRVARAALALLALLAAPAVLAEDIVAAVQKQLQRPALVRGEFVQTKRLQGFKKPLESRGRFWIARERGVLWQTTQPFASTLLITPEQVIQKDRTGTALRFDAGKEPTVRAINSALFSLFSGDVSTLQRLFDVQGELRGAHWQLVLRPREASFAAVIKTVRLSGAQLVSGIEIDDVNGDQTAIRFDNIVGAGALTADEAARFE